MKILSEKEQKQNKLGEISSLRSHMFAEIQVLQKQRNKEMSKKENYFSFTKFDYALVNSLHERINRIQKVIENLNDYQDMICDSMNDKKDIL